MTNREYFYTEYKAWQQETSLLSVGMYENEHFDNIVKMGVKAVPYLIEVLEEGPNHIVHACDLIYPDEVTYEGYIPLDFGCETWVQILKYKFYNNEISEQENNS